MYNVVNIEGYIPRYKVLESDFEEYNLRFSG